MRQNTLSLSKEDVVENVGLDMVAEKTALRNIEPYSSTRY
jgi:hypothetical protein